MIVTVVVAAVVIVPHEIQEETFRLHGSLAIFTLDSSNRSRYGALDEVQASVGEVVRSCHWRAG